MLDLFRSLQQLRDSAETLVVEKEGKSVEADLTDPDVSVRPGALVSTKVHCQWRTAAWWVGRSIATALDIGLY